MSAERMLPTPDQDSQPYWDAARRGELLIQRCAACGEYQFYPRSLCIACGAGDPEWARASGRGTVYSYTVNHRPAGPWFAQRVPYVVALIDLDEGPRLMANIDAPPPDVAIGLPVEVWFEEASPEVTLPQFRLAGTRKQQRAHEEVR